MNVLDRARKASELVNTMVEAFTELTDNYWHEDSGNGHGLNQLNIELGHADKVATRELHCAEQAALHHKATGGEE